MKLSRSLLCISVFLCLPLCPVQAQRPLRFMVPADLPDASRDALTEWARVVSAETAGRVRLGAIPSVSPHERNARAAFRERVVTAVPAAELARRIPQAAVWELPGVLLDQESFDHANSTLSRLTSQALAEQGLTFICAMPTGHIRWVTSEAGAIREPSDLENRTILVDPYSRLLTSSTGEGVASRWFSESLATALSNEPSLVRYGRVHLTHLHRLIQHDLTVSSMPSSLSIRLLVTRSDNLSGLSHADRNTFLQTGRAACGRASRANFRLWSRFRSLANAQQPEGVMVPEPTDSARQTWLTYLARRRRLLVSRISLDSESELIERIAQRSQLPLSITFEDASQIIRDAEANCGGASSSVEELQIDVAHDGSLRIASFVGATEQEQCWQQQLGGMRAPPSRLPATRVIYHGRGRPREGPIRESPREIEVWRVRERYTNMIIRRWLNRSDVLRRMLVDQYRHLTCHADVTRGPLSGRAIRMGVGIRGFLHDRDRGRYYTGLRYQTTFHLIDDQGSSSTSILFGSSPDAISASIDAETASDRTMFTFSSGGVRRRGGGGYRLAQSEGTTWFSERRRSARLRGVSAEGRLQPNEASIRVQEVRGPAASRLSQVVDEGESYTLSVRDLECVVGAHHGSRPPRRDATSEPGND